MMMRRFIPVQIGSSGRAGRHSPLIIIVCAGRLRAHPFIGSDDDDLLARDSSAMHVVVVRGNLGTFNADPHTARIRDPHTICHIQHATHGPADP